MERIGILGGTFDPPHIGHLIIAQEVLSTLQLDEIWFIPTYEPPHKKDARVQVNERIKMLKLAIQDNLSFKLNTIEIDRKGKSYTYDTMVTLKEEFPNTEFFFIIGGDMVEYLPKWYKIEELVQLINFVGVKRTGYSLQTPYPLIEVDIPVIDISSTIIRERIKGRNSIQYLVPKSVENFIKEHGYYE